jgi:hypothetical protein
VRRSRRPIEYVFISGLGISIAPCGLMFFLWTVPIQATLLTVATACWSRSRRSPWTYLMLSFLATVAAYVFTASWAWRDLSEMRQDYPYVSLEGRLPRSTLQTSRPLSPEASAHLDSLSEAVEEKINTGGGPWTGSRRSFAAAPRKRRPPVCDEPRIRRRADAICSIQMVSRPRAADGASHFATRS